MNADGTNQIRLTNNQAVDSRPVFSPDGKQLAFSSNRDGNAEVYVMASDGSGSPTRLTYNQGEDYKPDWGSLPQIPVEIKPGSCPTPLNVKAEGALPVAVLRTENFDVTQLDPDSVKLEVVSPLRSRIEDVATPFEPFTGKEQTGDCSEAGSDGFEDLVFKFEAQKLSTALGSTTDGEVRVLNLTGNLKPEFGSLPVVGEDVVVIKK